MIEHFDIEQFQAALKSMGLESVHYLEKNEYCFDVPYKGINIHIRSSIGENGKSDGTGENSIRVYMRAGQDYLGKIDAYTTRVKGWEARLGDKIDEIKHYRDLSGDCPACKKSMGVYKVKKKNENHGRLFARCEKDNTFIWLDEEREASFNLAVSDDVIAELVKEPEPEQPIAEKADNSNRFLAMLDMLPEPLPVEDSQALIAASFNLQDILDFMPEEEIAPRGEPNEYQMAIVDAPLNQPMRILAGPGSGKTFTVSRRYSHMVMDLGIVPTEIVVVTFNKLAAENMLKKIVEQCPIPPEAMNQICTIHALCLRALKGFYKEFSKRSLSANYILEKVLKGLLVNLEPVEDARPGWEEMLSWINTSKAHGVTPSNVANWFMSVNPDLHSSVGKLLQDCRIGLDKALQTENQWTFNDMLYEMEQALFTDPAFLDYWQRKFKYLIVDEAQDTAAQAVRILTKLFSHTNQIMMVGDGDQLLYRFTSATPENTLYKGFDQRYPDNNTFMLPINYRSTGKIVAYSKNVILNNYQPIGAYDGRFFKDMKPAPGAAEGVDIVMTSSQSAISEAHSILAMVKSLIAEGYQPGDFFIAARTRAQVGYLEAAFALSDVPYVNVVGNSFFDLPHIKHVLSYMQLVADPYNQAAFANIYNVASGKMTVPWSTAPDYGDYCQHRFLTAEFLATAKHYKGMVELMSYHTRVKPKPSWKAGMNDLNDLMYELMAADEDGPAALVTAIVDNCYRKYVISQTGSEEGVGEGGRLDDIATIKEMASGFTSLLDFVQYVDNVIAASKAAQNKEWDGRAVLATIHRLKGLERPVVIGVGVSEGVDGQTGLLPHTFSLVEPPNNGKMPGNPKGQVADERCLFFVLISRAEKMVILSSIESYREKPMMPSRFLSELSIN
jgi:DNA helicase-2/ATP-dependent DNA helicase PcrA